MVFYYVKRLGKWHPQKSSSTPYNETSEMRKLRTVAVPLPFNRVSWSLDELSHMYPMNKELPN